MESDREWRLRRAALCVRCHIGVGSKCEAVTARAEKSRVAVARGRNTREELMGGVGAAVLVAPGTVGLGNGHAGSRCFANIQRSAVATEHFDGRPLWQDWTGGWGVGTEFLTGMNNPAVHDGENGLDAFNLVFRHRKVIVRERDKIRQLAGGNCSFLPALARKPTAALRIEAQRLVPAETIFFG